jgi:hypothetical protein
MVELVILMGLLQCVLDLNQELIPLHQLLLDRW